MNFWSGLKNDKRKYLSNVGILVLAGFLCSCVGSPASAPAPLAEIPSVISVPDGQIDVSTISSGSPVQQKFLAQGKRYVGPNGEFSRVISIGPDSVEGINVVLNDSLDIINAAQIPVSSEIFNFDFAEFVDPATQLPRSRIKYDFSPFDFDGDGVPEACSGCTCPTGCAPEVEECPSEAPLTDLQKVCFRIWVQKNAAEDSPFERIAAGYFDILPLEDDPNTPENEENAGTGTYIIGGSGETNYAEKIPAVGSLFINVIYDHFDLNDPLNLMTSLSQVTEIVDQFGKMLGRQSINSFVSQIPIDSSGDPNHVQKTVKTTENNFETVGDNLDETVSGESEYIGRYREDLDFWSGSFFFDENLDDEIVDIFFPTVCARISTGDGVPQEICQDAGIDTTDETPLPPAEDIEFPADFPTAPTF